MGRWWDDAIGQGLRIDNAARRGGAMQMQAAIWNSFSLSYSMKMILVRLRSKHLFAIDFAVTCLIYMIDSRSFQF